MKLTLEGISRWISRPSIVYKGRQRRHQRPKPSRVLGTSTTFKFRVKTNRCIQYQLKFVLTATDRIQCLSPTTRQRLLGVKTKVIFVSKLWLDTGLDRRYSHIHHQNRSILFICAIDTQVLLIIVIRTLPVRQSVLVNDFYQILPCQHKRDPCRLKVLWRHVIGKNKIILVTQVFLRKCNQFTSLYLSSCSVFDWSS
jgi:hypothetical protein